MKLSQYIHTMNGHIYDYLRQMRYLSRWFVFFLDLALCSISFLLSSAVISRFVPSLKSYSSVGLLLYELLIVMLVQACCILVSGSYMRVLRFSTYSDLTKLVFTQGVCSAVLLCVVTPLANHFGSVRLFDGFSLLCYFITSYMLLGTLRVMVRMLFESTAQYMHRKPLLVIGNRESNVRALNLLKLDNDTTYKVVALVEDERVNIDKRIMNVPIFPVNDENGIKEFIKKRGVKHVLITSKEYVYADSNRMVSELNDMGMMLFELPRMDVMLGPGEDDSRRYKMKRICIEDLLDREPIVLNDDAISHWVQDAVVMVTGAAGSIGSEIVRQLTHYNPSHLVLLDNAETPLHALQVELNDMGKAVHYTSVVADVRNGSRIDQIVGEYAPKVIYHAAAYKHVPMMEDNPSEAVLTNVMGSKHVADAALRHGVERMVMVSTDKAVNPSNVMGASKRIAEIYVQSLNVGCCASNSGSSVFITTRFGNVLGSNGSVIPFFQKQIEQGGPVQVTHPDIIRYFMTIPEAAQLVLQAGTMGEGGEIYIFDMGKPVKILDLAKRMIRLAGLVPDEDIRIVFSGLRPGEKLYEELLNDTEHTKATYNEKIHIADVEHRNHEEVVESVLALITLSSHFDQDNVVKCMKQIVPDFVSLNSVYGRFDKEPNPTSPSKKSVLQTSV